MLHALYGVGTDITVTKSPTAGSGGPFGFRVGSGQGQTSRPKAGTTFTRNTLAAAGQGTLKASSVTAVARLGHVSAAAGGLTLTDTLPRGGICDNGEPRSRRPVAAGSPPGHPAHRAAGHGGAGQMQRHRRVPSGRAAAPGQTAVRRHRRSRGPWGGGPGPREETFTG